MACQTSTSVTGVRCAPVRKVEMDAYLIQDTNRRSTVNTEHMTLTYDEDDYDEECGVFSENVDTDEYEEEEEDTRFLDVCMDGDVEDMVQLLEEMAAAGETLGSDMLNCADCTGRVSYQQYVKFSHLKISKHYYY